MQPMIMRRRGSDRRPRGPADLRTSAVAALALACLACPIRQAASQTVAPARADGDRLRARLALTMAPPGRPMPADESGLDAMLARGEMATLTARLRSARSLQDASLDLNWEQKQIFDGAGFMLSYAYMYDLWRVGFALPGEDGDGLKQAAAMMFLYSLDLIEVDGPRCDDVSAPAHRRDQLLGQNRSIVAYLQALPREKRSSAGSLSLDIESATAPSRKDDAVLCSGGLAEMREGLDANGGASLKRVPSAPGTGGEAYAVPPPVGFRPKFVGADVWRPKAEAARAALPSSLDRLLKLQD